jgi:membrane protein
MKILGAIYSLFKETFNGWAQANGNLLAAALAYYAIFSLAPLLVIAVSVAGVVFGPSAVTGLLVEEIGHLVSPDVAFTIQKAIENVYLTPTGDLATLISLVIMLVGASILFVQLKRAINFLWGVAPQPGKGLIITIQSHFLSFIMVFVIGLLVLIAMGLTTALVFLDELLNAILTSLETQLPRGDVRRRSNLALFHDRGNSDRLLPGSSQPGQRLWRSQLCNLDFDLGLLYDANRAHRG